MKAKEYIAKYESELNSSDEKVQDKAASDILIALSDEAFTLKETRHVKTTPALVSILKEKNDVWNVIARTFPDLIRKDGFKLYWLYKVPELKPYWI